MASKFVILIISLTLSAIVIPALADEIPSFEGLPPFPSPRPTWEPWPQFPPPPPTKNVTQQDIDSICSTAQDPKFCLNIITSIPETNRTNLKDLQTSVIQKALAIFNETLKAFPGLIDSIKEPELKDAYIMCNQHYYNAREDFMEGIKSMNKKVFYLPCYHIISDLSKVAILELNTCEIDLTLLLNKPNTPFTDKKNELTNYAHLVSAIGKYLYDTLKNFSAS